MTVALACAPGAMAEEEGFGRLHDHGHIVVIYQENHSFDNLYGLWGRVRDRAVNDLKFADPAHTKQARPDGVTPYAALLQDDVNLTSPPLPATFTDTNAAGNTFTSAFSNAPFNIGDYVAPTDTTCPNPVGASQANGFLKGTGLPGGCTRDIVHRFYNEQFQIDGGKQNRYVTGSDAAGLAMGYFDTTALPIYKYLHQRGAPNYVIADNFFQAAFGGSFLNHQWLIAAATPVFAGADNTGGANDLHSALDANLMPTNTPLYVSPLGGAVRDTALTQSCNPPAGRPVTQPSAVCGDYAVNTIQPWYWPYAPGTSPARRLPPLNTPNIGDRLSDAGVDWAWYAGGWSNANGLVGAPGWTNGPGGSCTDPNAVTVQPSPGVTYCPDKLFQYHHQPFNYYSRYATGAADRTDHLRDEEEFISAAKSGRLKPVSFIKPIGEQNEHPGYTNENGGDQHLVDLIDAILKGPNGHNTLIIVTYDEFGGQWDHVPPPPYNQDRRAPHDVWGPGTRIPALLISKNFHHSGVDHRAHDTTSILRLIEERYDLAPLGSRDAQVHSLRTVFEAAED